MLKLYDALTKKHIEIDKNKIVNMYMCGPTVYDYIHIGNARPIFLADFIIRYFKIANIDYNFLVNITDIDDKIINKAELENVSEEKISQKFTDKFLADLKDLNAIFPTKIIKVTDNVKLIIDFINDLISKESAYNIDGNVYFRINNFKKEYGKLSKQSLEMLNNSEKNIGLIEKENPLDFALWKKTNKGIKYNSPWGLGRPGWHTECCAFNDLYFNKTIDIHIGGIDLKFPHNENERIQFIAKNNFELSRIWIYNGHLSINNEKMSKSLNNSIYLKDFIAEYSADILRFIFFNSSYKTPFNISDDIISSSRKWTDKHEKLIKTVNYKFFLKEVKPIFGVQEETKIWESKILSYFNDDINTPMIVSIIDEIYKKIANSLKNNQVSQEIFDFYYNLMKNLGFCSKIKLLDKSDEETLLKWKQALENKNYNEADILRQSLIEKGVL